ncbi:MAG: penicillin-binding transpeptidase domain-containing protein, partial [Armatimonadota bacterium]|nr:penicillin-binding transpeptidase domain-containing protein [Armatimonadota bacterium]
GTGKTARARGYVVAGKTGSAQKAESGRYVPGKFVASFVGFAPADDPRVVVIVVVDEPKGSHWGATCAAPAFREIVEGALWHLKVPPDRPLELQQAAADKS